MQSYKVCDWAKVVSVRTPTYACIVCNKIDLSHFSLYFIESVGSEEVDDWVKVLLALVR